MSKICSRIHELVHKLPIHRFPFDNRKIPLNGVYVLFQEGELGHGAQRIVRVGTHTGNNQLRSRLKQHFMNENKDRSIFRKNIGRAILTKNSDPFLNDWEIDLTTKKAKEKYASSINLDYQQSIEQKVSAYIQVNFTFVVFPFADKDTRLDIESKLISTVSLCNVCKHSSDWFGLYSPKDKIRESGMWLVNKLYQTGFTEQDLDYLENVMVSP